MNRPSITCPHCGLKSFLKADISARYCGKCGYHDADLSVPPGIPGRSAKWRQPTPLMQLEATIATFEAQSYLWKEDLTTDGVYTQLLDRFHADVRELMPHVKNGNWKKES